MIRVKTPDESVKPAPPGALEELVFEIFRLNALLLAAGDELTRDLGLTSARWQILGALNAAGRPLTVSQTARNMALTRQAVQRVADDLARGGFTRYAANADHARSKLITVTAEGRAAFAAAMRLQSRWERVTLTDAGFDERKIRALLSRLNALRQALERSEDR